MPRMLANGIVQPCANDMSQTGSVPLAAEPTTLPMAPTPKATAIDATATSTVATALPPMTFPRRGTSVNVVSPLRWLHSLVTARIATTGSTIVIGTPMAAAKAPYATSASGAKSTTAVLARTAVMTMLAINQKPDRVSNILRSSTP